MSLSNVKCVDVTIPNGAANSNVVKAREQYDDAAVLTLYAPAVLDAFTFTLEVTEAPDDAAPVFRTLQVGDPAADAVPPPVGKARAYFELSAAMGFRIHSSSNVAADRTWKLTKQIPAYAAT